MLPLSVVLLSAVQLPPAGLRAPAPPVDFAREVAPLLADRCFACHGPDEAAREAGLRLDRREDALMPAESGRRAVVPGAAADSALVARIEHPSARQRMPPPSSGKELSAAERATLARWIDEGARWSSHWAWTAPEAAAAPEVRDAAWCREPLDRFVLAGLEAAGLAPSPEADPITLVRRATLTLTGLPPTPDEVDRFVADVAREAAARAADGPAGGAARPDAYDRLLERLFASPAYGERAALPWLDAARYADSNGFQQDGDTQQWVWRDWLVQALNDDVPLDRLATLMLAGDLLPAADARAAQEQQVATAFLRLHLLNGEGGSIAEEQRNVIVFDRVDAFATTFLGLTAACAQCHDHKFDPLTQREYYALFDYFNRVPESGRPDTGGAYRLAEPFITVPSNADRVLLAQAEGALDAAEAALTQQLAAPGLLAAEADWAARTLADARRLSLGPWEAAAPIPATSFDGAYATAWEAAKGWAPRPELVDGAVHRLTGEATAFFFRRALQVEPGPGSASEAGVTLHFGSDDGLRVWLDGALVLEDKASRAAAPDQARVSVTLAPGAHTLVVLIANGGGPGGLWFEARVAGLPVQDAAELAGALPSDLPSDLPRDLPNDIAGEAGARSPETAARLRAAFLAAAPPTEVAAALAARDTRRAELEALRATLPRVMVMSDARPRETHVLSRGNYEAPLEAVTAGTPAFLPPQPPDARGDRLGLARWLVSAENPLFARVMVNHAWQLVFGAGLVKTAEDFGAQGAAPSHPELLDTLAVSLRAGGWSAKELHRTLVASATFRQSSRLTGERGARLMALDPENRLLARGARRRLPAMLLRDVALAASGLLVRELGGPPVYPYQPPGIWDGLAITKEREFTYPQSSGAALYRRSLYTFWRRTVAPGNMFDASQRQACKVRASVTSTPLHALTMLNDPTWVEAARALAQAAMHREAGLGAQVEFAFRRVVARGPAPDERDVLTRGFMRAHERFAADAAAAEALLSVGESARDVALDSAAHAALTVVCLTIFNLDEALTCE
ncbi:MAG: PSD1 and planctomycete cytochrome C domain-containing protein [Planctomycetota bacterium]